MQSGASFTNIFIVLVAFSMAEFTNTNLFLFIDVILSLLFKIGKKYFEY